MDDKECKYLGKDSGDCWLCSGNIFQKCMYSNKEKCLLIKNEQRKNKINELENQYTAVVAQNKSLQGELRLANKIINIMAEQLAVDDICNSWNVVMTCQPETIPCEECIKKHYELEALQELEADND